MVAVAIAVHGCEEVQKHFSSLGTAWQNFTKFIPWWIFQYLFDSNGEVLTLNTGAKSDMNSASCRSLNILKFAPRA